jgi:hypothetical protein
MEPTEAIWRTGALRMTDLDYLLESHTPQDPLALAVAADWMEEHGRQGAAQCLRWALRTGRLPFSGDWSSEQPIPRKWLAAGGRKRWHGWYAQQMFHAPLAEGLDEAILPRALASAMPVWDNAADGGAGARFFVSRSEAFLALCAAWELLGEEGQAACLTWLPGPADPTPDLF